MGQKIKGTDYITSLNNSNTKERKLINRNQLSNTITIRKKHTNIKNHKIITAVCTCITTIAAIILTSACTLSLSVQKQNNNSNQGTEQTTSVDSLSINPVLKK